MPRTRGHEAFALAPEVMLRKATLARTAGLRAKYARQGLSTPASLDKTTRLLLLRQLYLSHIEEREFAEARGIAEEMVGLDVMVDVARQDAARACIALGEPEAAIDHLRLASRSGPASRRAFHLWTLGSLLYLNGHPEPAIGVLGRALRWATKERPLYRAQLALARLACGEPAGDDLQELRKRLSEAPCGQGYGQFVLGELAALTNDRVSAIQYLERFVARTSTGRVALAVALEGELSRARKLLRRLKRGRRAPPAND
jgi:tetratricopeptide (TPR) repeat protein